MGGAFCLLAGAGLSLAIATTCALCSTRTESHALSSDEAERLWTGAQSHVNPNLLDSSRADGTGASAMSTCNGRPPTDRRDDSRAGTRVEP